MGIDIYLSWKGQSQSEKALQDLIVAHGEFGCLRESYHGGPYATHVLMPEAFTDDQGEQSVQIPAEVLRRRLPATIETAIARMVKVYGQNREEARNGDMVKSFIAFVELAERKEKETGECCTIHASY
jgi:hypothetical protein